VHPGSVGLSHSAALLRSFFGVEDRGFDVAPDAAHVAPELDPRQGAAATSFTHGEIGTAMSCLVGEADVARIVRCERERRSSPYSLRRGSGSEPTLAARLIGDRGVRQSLLDERSRRRPARCVPRHRAHELLAAQA